MLQLRTHAAPIPATAAAAPSHALLLARRRRPSLPAPNPAGVGFRRRLLPPAASLAQDAPFAAAIGACVLATLASPPSAGEEEDRDGGGGPVDAADTRLAVMAMIGFVPYFNWLSWVFAWLDTGRRQYLVYAIVYLAPYFRTSLSLSPDDSWLPIGSIIVGILHIQLEASIMNGDINAIKFFSQAGKTINPRSRRHHVKGPGKRNGKLPSRHGSRDLFRESDISTERQEEHDVEDERRSK